MTKRAVVVGVNDYSVLTPSGDDNLRFCVADAQSMYWMLVDAFGFDRNNIRLYLDQTATASNILSALRYIIANSEAGDVACFYFAGHGTRVRAEHNRADCDKYFEAIVPYSGGFITDWDIRGIAETLEPSYVNYTLILDSCHSGGMHDSDALQKCRSPLLSNELIQNMINYLKTIIPFGICLPDGSTACDNNVSNVSTGTFGVDLDEDPDKTLVARSKSTLISGCKFTESSWEDPAASHGLLTQAFLKVVNESNFSISYSELLNLLRLNVHTGVPDGESQTPQLRGQMNRMEEGFLAGWRDSK